MKYTWQVIQECLRIQPAVETGFQECVKEFEYEGFTIPKGWRLFWHLGRSRISPQLFPNPERFDPDWFEGLGPPPPFTYMPFGGGPQICLGMEFARTKMVVFLHHLVLNYEWSMVNPNEGVVRNPLPVFQKGLPLKISKKQSLEFHCRRLNKEWERRSCQVKCELRAVKKKACVADCALRVANMLGFSRCHEDLRLNILCLFSIRMHIFFEFQNFAT